MKNLIFCVLVFVYLFANNIAVASSLEEDVKKANQGDAASQYDLGKRYFHGIEIDKDYEKAFIWFEKSALQRNARSENNIAIMYLYGLFVQKNIDNALQWFIKSSNDGLNIADSNLGIIYINGIGVAVDENKGLAYLMKAANQSSIEAQYDLGKYYFLKKDFSKAKYWFTFVLENKERPNRHFDFEPDFKKYSNEFLAEMKRKR